MEFFNKWAAIFMDLLTKDFKVSVLDAAAIVGNAGHESAGFKSLQEIKPLVPGSRGGYGIMQWTGPRRREYEAYCKRNGLDPADMMSNYKFLFVELKGPEGRVLEKLKKGKTLNEKTKIFSETFLRPGIPHMESRYIWAGRALEAYEKAQKGKTPTEPSKPASEAPVAKERTLWDIIVSILRKLFK